MRLGNPSPFQRNPKRPAGARRFLRLSQPVLSRMKPMLRLRSVTPLNQSPPATQFSGGRSIASKTSTTGFNSCFRETTRLGDSSSNERNFTSPVQRIGFHPAFGERLPAKVVHASHF